jgi:hypothetical protein
MGYDSGKQVTIGEIAAILPYLNAGSGSSSKYYFEN